MIQKVERAQCATQHIAPPSLSGAELDEYLAKGWYRIGQHMIFCECISWKQDISGVIWTRVPLRGYRFKKSLRRTKRQVERRFIVEIGPMQCDEEHEIIYRRYLSVAPGERSAQLKDVLLGSQPDRGLFETWEVTLRTPKGELAAFSLFDLGERSIQSIIGVYDPAHASHSLGLYTMLRELEFGIERGFEHYYAGYVLCHDDTMHYKLRTGQVELLDRTRGVWVKRDALDIDAHDPFERTQHALERAKESEPLFEGWAFYRNVHFELSAYAPNLKSCLYYPLVLWRDEVPGSPFVVVLAWDSITERYELLRCLRGVLATPDGTVTVRDIFVVDRSLGRYDEPPDSIPYQPDDENEYS